MPTEQIAADKTEAGRSPLPTTTTSKPKVLVVGSEDLPASVLAAAICSVGMPMQKDILNCCQLVFFQRQVTSCLKI